MSAGLSWLRFALFAPITPLMVFFLGTNEPAWLARTAVPLMVSRRRLARRVRLPRARGLWFLDSGGFTELSKFGRWSLTPREYVRFVRRCRDEVGRLVAVAPMDWMCEPSVRALTGLSVAAHIRRTVENYDTLLQLDSGLPWLPVVQGWSLPDYLRCVDLYDSRGLLRPVVGVGSICRREGTAAAAAIVTALAGRGLRVHAFGAKTAGLELYGDRLAGADSMSWSYGAWRRRVKLAGCSHPGHCGTCLRYALRWRRRLLSGLTPAAGAAISNGGETVWM